VLKQAVLHATGDVLLPGFFPSRLRATLREPTEGARAAEVHRTPLESLIDRELAAGGGEIYAKSLAFLERTLLARVLRHTGGNQSRAAKLLGITRGSLRNKIRLLRITINPAVRVEEDARTSDT
jgi:two-component system nitrogen regulation response regulator GlnG